MVPWHDTDGIGYAAADHKAFILIQHEQAGYGKDISEGDGRSRCTENEGIEDPIADHEIQPVKIGGLPLDLQDNITDKEGNPAKDQKDHILVHGVQVSCCI